MARKPYEIYTCVCACVCIGTRQCLLAISILIFFSCSSVFVCNLNLLYNFIVKCLLTAFCPTYIFALTSSSTLFRSSSLFHFFSFVISYPSNFLCSTFKLFVYFSAKLGSLYVVATHKITHNTKFHFGVANKKHNLLQNAMPI